MAFSLKSPAKAEPQAGFVALEALRQRWIPGFLLRSGRTIPLLSTTLDAHDKLGDLKARWAIGRMDYQVLPGLYGVGNPGPESPVFVTANYKLSLDRLRPSLAGLDAWILVLDTKGINVWCAAGKGSFGTEELVSRIAKTRLGEIVSHRRLYLPQLGASGVCAPEVAWRSGFAVEWGPVRAQDIPAWLAAGRVKDAAMARVSFTLPERMAVAPVELVHAWPLVPAALVLALLMGLPFRPGWQERSLSTLVLTLGLVPVGTLLFPALLPWLPTKAFSLKGAFLGLLWAALCAIIFGLSPLMAASAILVAVPVVAFLGMNFTGSSTYTCQPGALLEVERGFWPMLSSLVLGLALGIAARALGL